MKPGDRKAVCLRDGTRIGIVACEADGRFTYQVKRVRGYAHDRDSAIALAHKVAKLIGVDQEAPNDEKESDAA